MHIDEAHRAHPAGIRRAARGRAALHINARTPRDSSAGPRICACGPQDPMWCIEFGTVWRWPSRRAFPPSHLEALAGAVARPLHLVMIGGMDAVPTLTRAFADITVVDAVPFLKAVKRQRLSERQ